ncbi:MAG: peptide deformylase [Planctomycetaceae bacterium]|nr:peptide deformylase [Planctomycetaceae bacterium]
MEVLSYPNPVLMRKCTPVAVINQRLRDLVSEMLRTMYEFRGVGLAANQVGYPLQLFVMNETGDIEKPEYEHVLINPIIKKRKGILVDEEGCLSFPGIYADVNRSEFIEIESIAIDGSIQRFKWKERPARIAQHEYDHLQGICFVDRLQELNLQEINTKLEELKINYENNVKQGLMPSDEETQKFIAELEKQFCE